MQSIEKIYLLLFWVLLAGIPSFSQSTVGDCTNPQGNNYLHGNDVRAFINNSGSLFFDGNQSAFQVPYSTTSSPTTIFVDGLWLGGLDPGGNLKMAAMTYGVANGGAEYWAGPLDPVNGSITHEDCDIWDRVWKVSRYQIETHLNDLADDGAIDNPVPAIFEWPGIGNPYFESLFGIELMELQHPNKLAPFYDSDMDGIYDPLKGDYPVVPQSATLPEEITWTIFNDNGGLHTETNGVPIRAEIHLLTWAYACENNDLLNQTIFTSYKVINRAQESIDSFQFSKFVDFDLGCFEDDYVGCNPELNTFFVYNADLIDGGQNGECALGILTYGEEPPTQAVTFLNQEMSSFMYINNVIGNPFPGTTDPSTALEYYHFATGSFRDGTPLTHGGDGYDPASIDFTNFAFPDDPNDPDGWSMNTESLLPDTDRRSIASTTIGTLVPGQAIIVDLAYSFHRGVSNNNLENVSLLYEEVGNIKDYYVSGFFDMDCAQSLLCEDDCVWAGDTNADGIANNCDLLPIGVALNQEGSMRPSPYNWSPRTGEAWGSALPSGTNYKHIDADGNGLVTANDFELTVNHYNLTNPKYNPEDEYQEGPELVFGTLGGASFENLEEGDVVPGVASLGVDVSDLQGLAFTIEYDPAYFDLFQPTGSGFSPTNMEFVTDGVFAAEHNRVEYALVNTPPSQEINPGILVFFQAHVRDEFDPVPSETSLIRFKNVKGINSSGETIDIGGTAMLATFLNLPLGVDELSENVFQIFPNPTNGDLTISYSDLQVDNVEVIDALGSVVYQSFNLGIASTQLNISHLPKGIYFVKVQSGTQFLVKKILLEK